MGYVSTGMGDCFSALLMFLLALRLTLVDRNPGRPCYDIVLPLFVVPLGNICYVISWLPGMKMVL